MSNDYNDNKNKEDGSPKKKKKKAARKEQEKTVAKEAEGATKSYDEAEVKLAKVILKGKRIAESWPGRPDQDDGITCKKLRKRIAADAECFGNSIFDIIGDAATIRLAPILIALSGRRKTRGEQDVSAVGNVQKVQRAAEGRPGHEAHLRVTSSWPKRASGPPS
jgi:hypothetical protein